MPFPVVPPTPGLEAQFNAATAEGDIDAVRGLKDAAAGTSLVAQLDQSARTMERAAAPVRRVLEASDAKGGIETPAGRLAAADALKVQSQLKDWDSLHTPTSIVQGIANRFMGVPDPWKAATRGTKQARIEYDEQGRGAYSVYYQNNPNTPAYVIDPDNKTVITPDEYERRGFQKFKDPAQSPFVQAQGAVFKANLEGLNNLKEKANRNSASGAALGTLSQQIEQAATELATRYQLPSKALDELSALTSKVLTDDTEISKSRQAMNQGQTTDSRRKGAEELSRMGVLGDVKIVGVNAQGQFVGSDNKTYTVADLNQMIDSNLSKRSRNERYEQARQQLVNSAIYRSLPDNESKTLADNMFNNFIRMHTITEDLRRDNAALPFVTLDVPFEKGQPYAVGIANSIVQQANAEHMIAFGKFMDQEYAKNKTNPPPKGQLEAAYTRSEEFKKINARAAERIQQVERTKFGTVEATPSAVNSQDVGGTALAPMTVETPEVPEKKKPSKLPERSVVKKQAAPDHAKAFLDSLPKSGGTK